MTEPNTGKSPHLHLLAWCDYIEALVGTPTLGRGKTPPLAAFRPNAAGRRAWLDQTGRELKRSEYACHITLERGLPTTTKED